MKKRLVVISIEKKVDKIFLSTQKFIRENECSINDRNLELIFYENLYWTKGGGRREDGRLVSKQEPTLWRSWWEQLVL